MVKKTKYRRKEQTSKERNRRYRERKKAEGLEQFNIVLGYEERRILEQFVLEQDIAPSKVIGFALQFLCMPKKQKMFYRYLSTKLDKEAKVEHPGDNNAVDEVTAQVKQV
ncbi:MAG: hypothetical protein HQL70_11745 [Magnetococcales bacterium]|nr:hypothetical protein [Magnetococcales bacterium]